MECNRYGIDACFPILQSVMSLQDAMSREITLHQLTFTSQQVFCLFAVKEKNGRICKMTDTSVSISAPVFFLSVHPQTSKKSEFQVKHFCQYL